MCMFMWGRVAFFKRAETEDEGFKLTEHASASQRLNYQVTKKKGKRKKKHLVSGVALEVSGNKCPLQR